MNKIIPVIFATLCFVTGRAQEKEIAPKKIRTLEVSDTIVFATVDRPGDLYLITDDGQFQKFDKDGKLVIVYKNKTLPTVFDPRDGARLFAYYRQSQEYMYYNPSFDVTGAFRIDPAFAIQPWLLCPSGDHKLWVLDGVDHSLKKINPKDSEVELEVVVDATIIQNAHAFTVLREYQGFVFLLNPHKGIFIFNNLGKHIKTIEAAGIHQFNFLGEELYYVHNKQLHFLDLFSAEERTLPPVQQGRMYLLTDERQFVAGYKTVDIFEFKP
jgi:hypothetical protein